GGDHGVVGRDVEGVDVEGVGGLLDLTGVRHGGDLDGDAELGGGLLRELDLDLGVHLARGVDDAHRLGVGDDLGEQLELVGHRVEVARAGDVRAGRVPAVDEAGLLRLGDGGDDDRHVGDRLGRRLR